MSDTFEMAIVSINGNTGDVRLESSETDDAPATMIWHYGKDCDIEDKLGDTFEITIRASAVVHH
jgi:hypothetical protein